MANEDKYTRESISETIEVDKDSLDFDTISSICAMIEETLHKEATKFTDVLDQLTKTYRKEFVIGEFSVCLAISSGVHEEPIVSLVAGSVPGTVKNLLCLNKGFKEIMHDKAAD